MGGMLAASSSAVGSAAGAATATATATGKNSQGAGRDYLGMAMPSGEDDGGIASFLCGGTTSDEVLAVLPGNTPFVHVVLCRRRQFELSQSTHKGYNIQMA